MDSIHTPPRRAEWLLGRFISGQERSLVLGDLAEEYAYHCETVGVSAAKRWYWRQAVTSIPVFFLRAVYWGSIMWAHYLMIALRNIIRQPGYAGINIFGLTVGMTCAVLILMYVQHERSYDRFHEKANRLYRLTAGNSALTVPELGPMLKDAFPEVIGYARLIPTGNYWLMRHGDKAIRETDVFQTESSVFELFDFPLIEGDPRTALQAPMSMIISETTGRKYFGEADPIGQVVNVDNYWNFTVTGIMRDFPEHSHLQADFLTSFIGEPDYPRPPGEWGNRNFHTYILLAANTSVGDLNEKIRTFIDELPDAAVRPDNRSTGAYLQPITDIHLYSRLDQETGEGGSVSFLYIMSTLGAFMLLIACINFINLATARSAGRALEVGIRKAIGAYRGQLVRQFMTEAVLIATIAVFPTLVLVHLALPWFNGITDKALTFDMDMCRSLAPALVAIVLGVGLISGAYPALFLSAFKPITALNGLSQLQSSRGMLRRLLVVVQFTMAIVLIVGAVLFRQQLDYVRNKSLGFSKDQTLMIDGDPGGYQWDSYDLWKAELMTHTRILGVTRSSFTPDKDAGTVRIVRIDDPLSDPITVTDHPTIDDYIETMGLQRLAGDPLRAGWRDNPNFRPVILNETAVRRLGWTTPEAAINKQIMQVRENEQRETDGKTVIAVVKDFHWRSLHYPIEPLMIRVFHVLNGGNPVVRIAPGERQLTMTFIRQTWEKHFPVVPFNYTFMDSAFDRLYRTEERLSNICAVFVAIAILIAVVGLFGLASFMAEQRTKEIGIRKVLGASVFSLVGLLSREFMALVLVANIAAWPLAYLLMRRWLQTFAYRVDIGFEIFFLAGFLGLMIALLTVSYHAVKAATSNPVETLRYE